MRKYFYFAAPLMFLVFAVILVSRAQDPQSGGLLKEFRPIGGGHNNLLHPEYDPTPGSAELNIAPLRFADAASLDPMPGPNPRMISNIIAGGASSSGDDSQSTDPVASAWLYVFGQFVDHDLSLEFSSPQGTPFNIAVAPGDPVFPDGGIIKMTRDVKNPRTRTVINTTAGYLDLSQLYGSSAEVAASLRDRDGPLKTSHDGQALQIIDGRFVSGDPRVDENPEIAMVTMLFMREHNYWVAELKRLHPDWTGNQFYQMARAITTAEYQNIIYTEFLPLLIGPVLGPYLGYDPRVNAQVTQEFSTAAFRVGHTQVSETQSGRDNDGNITYTQSLAQAFFNMPEETLANGVNALMRNVTAEFSQATDVYTVPVLRNMLFATLPGGNLDLVDLIAIDIQRGRDVGLNTLNQTRKALGLAPYASFAELTADTTLQAQFQALYRNIDEVDLFMGGQAERHAEGAVVGATFREILRRQFHALRVGDRFFWANQGFGPEMEARIAKTTLSEIIKRNTDTVRVPPNAFLAEGDGEARPRRKPHAPAGPVDNHGRFGVPFTIP
jgi:peroxidase